MKKKYRNLDLKLTPQRMAILEYLENNKGHPSAIEIYKAITKKFPTISFSTVYNTLEILTKKAMIKELSIDVNRKRYDTDIKSHHHFICKDCKKIFDVYKDFKLKIENLEKEGFEINENHIEFYGFCPSCKRKSIKKKEVIYGNSANKT